MSKKLMEFINKCLCGDKAKLGDVAEFLTKGTEIDIPLQEGDKVLHTRCWCCAFWRGIVLGGIIGLFLGVLL